MEDLTSIATKNDIDDFLCELKNYRFELPFLLFHGTDRRVLDMKQDERIEKKDVWLKFIDGVIKNGILEEVVHKKIECEDSSEYAISAAVMMAKKSSWFEYDNIYVTKSVSKAREYAQKAVYIGEVGYVGYQLFNLLSNIYGTNFAQSILNNEEFLQIKIMCKEKIEPHPIILRYKGKITDIIGKESFDRKGFFDIEEDIRNIWKRILKFQEGSKEDIKWKNLDLYRPESYRLPSNIRFKDIFEEITIDDAMRLQKEKYEEIFLKYKDYLKEKYKSTEQQILI